MTVDVLGTVVTFEQPWLLMLGVVALAGLVANVSRERRPGGGLLFSSLGLVPRRGASWRVRLRWLLLPLRLAAVALLLLALARPLVARAAVAEGIDIAIALDISTSMAAKDFGGLTRIDAVKKVTKEFVTGLEDDRVALVAFQAEAFELSPPTLDHGALSRLVDTLDAGGLRLRGGTAIGLGMAAGIDLLRQSGTRSKVLIVLTDGENNAGEITPLDAAELAKLLNVRVYTIGAVPAPPPNVRQGSLEIDESLLRRIGEETGGQYHRASDADTLLAIYRDIATLEKSRVGSRGYADYEELYRPFLLAGAAVLLAEVFLAAAAFRRVP